MDRLEIPQTDDELRARLDALKAKGEELATVVPSRSATCPLCDDTGWRIVADADDIPRSTRCDCVFVDVAADGVPVEFQTATLTNYREDDGNRIALAKAHAFAASHRDLYLFGDVGAGKTRLACSILNEHARARHTAFFVRVPWMLHQLQPGRDSAGLELRLASTSLLVLDDLGAERDQATDYTRRTLLMLYEQRHDCGLRTIFTSNKSVQQLADMQDDRRLASRIIGQADVVPISTPDQRRVRRIR